MFALAWNGVITVRRITPAFSKIFLPWIVLFHGMIFVIFWRTNSLFYTSTNDFLTTLLKFPVISAWMASHF